jgi:hypothetical protein
MAEQQIARPRNPEKNMIRATGVGLHTGNKVYLTLRRRVIALRKTSAIFLT